MVTITGLSNGRPFIPDSLYTVALNSYRASGGGNHLSLGARVDKGERRKEEGGREEVDFRYLLMEWIRGKGTVEPVAGTNWKVVPVEWIKEAAPRDRARLFGEHR
jgi:2',3'-cyclic-nucleotide 2'-phosphodiesterase/3'-nucleotidase